MTTRLELRRRYESLDPFIAYPLARKILRWLHLRPYRRPSGIAKLRRDRRPICPHCNRVIHYARYDACQDRFQLRCRCGRRQLVDGQWLKAICGFSLHDSNHKR